MTSRAHEMPKLTPAEQKAYDDMRASPGILLDADGNVIFDGEAEAMGAVPFKNKAEIDAHQANLEALLATRRKEREREEYLRLRSPEVRRPTPE